jgi:hypothetical protein
VIDPLIASLAERQHGVAASWQLIAIALQKADHRVLRVTGDRLDDAPGAVLDDVLAMRRRRPAT